LLLIEEKDQTKRIPKTLMKVSEPTNSLTTYKFRVLSKIMAGLIV